MELKTFENVNKEELSMIEVAHAILEEKNDVMDFSDLVNQIQNYLGKADSEIREVLPQFYTDLNIDGSFISLGDNSWGLRSWYPFDSVDEEVTHNMDDEEDQPHRKKRKKVNAFLDMDDENAIDYNDDDPEDTDLSDEDEIDDPYSEEDGDEEEEEILAYGTELSEIGADDLDEGDEEIVPEGADEVLSIIEEEEESELNYDEENDEDVLDYGDET